MAELTGDGQRVVNDLAQRHGFSAEAVTHMLIAVINGNGGMAQFSHAEFGGSGQWMRGGMSMIGDMFNNYLKGRVDSLCSDIANIVNNQPGLLRVGSFQSQSQSSGGSGFSTAPTGPSRLFVPDPRAQWYPAELGMPNAVGSQNNLRYAYFANAQRLAVDTGGDVWVYDTLNHQIGGFSQQQGSSGSITFSSQFGTVSLTDLPVVMQNGKSVTASLRAQHTSSTSSHAPSSDDFAAIERLGDLKSKGVLTDDEFNTKKSELLSRI